MTNKQIEQYRQGLVDIQNMPHDKQAERYDALKKLAYEVGASVLSSYHVGHTATEAEISSNIHDALRTASMVNTCEIASKGHDVALKTTESAAKKFWILTIISILSLLAAWAAVVVNWLMNKNGNP